jgi:sugar phosphate isomerase/epimerase
MLIVARILFLLACLCFHLPAAAAPPFYVFDLGTGGGLPLPSLAAEARMARELGFDGEGKPLWLGDELTTNLAVLREAAMPPFLLLTTINVNPAKGPPYDPRLPLAIQRLAGQPATVCVMINGLPPGDTNGLAAGIKALRDLGDLAAKAGVRISIYHHVQTWTETLPFTTQVVRLANHPQVGFNFNVCHWNRVQPGQDFRPLLRANVSSLFGVTICGSDTNAQKWSNGLIQPLDKGNFDNRGFLSFLDEIGYRGPIGLMCYAIPGDPRDHLTRSMNTWRHWHTPP